MASAEYYREWRKRNPDKVKAAKKRYSAKHPDAGHREYVRRCRLDARRLLLDAYKAAPCVDCGNRYPAAVMELDHRPDTDKVADVSLLIRSAPPSGVFAEIAKCDLVCANCHRLRTLYRQLDRKEIK